MENGDLVKGLSDIEKILEKHEVASLNDPNNITLVTTMKSSGEQASYIIYGKGNKPRVSNKYATALLELHLCGDRCYLNSDQESSSEPNGFLY